MATLISFKFIISPNNPSPSKGGCDQFSRQHYPTKEKKSKAISYPCSSNQVTKKIDGSHLAAPGSPTIVGSCEMSFGQL